MLTYLIIVLDREFTNQMDLIVFLRPDLQICTLYILRPYRMAGKLTFQLVAEVELCLLHVPLIHHHKRGGMILSTS